MIAFYLVEFRKMSSVHSFIPENTINGIVSLRSKRFLHSHGGLSNKKYLITHSTEQKTPLDVTSTNLAKLRQYKLLASRKR